MVEANRSSRVHAVVTGIVQGVSYRYYTQKKAKELGLKGWVRNRKDGSVELVAEGERSKLELLLEWCRQGPAMARVENVQIRWEQVGLEFEDFSIRY